MNDLEKRGEIQGASQQLLEQLERRLDTLSHRLGLGILPPPGAPAGASRTHTGGRRQGGILSYEVSVGEEIAIRESSRRVPTLKRKGLRQPSAGAGVVGDQSRSIQGTRDRAAPREDIHPPVNEQLIEELYSKNRSSSASTSAGPATGERLTTSDSTRLGLAHFEPDQPVAAPDPNLLKQPGPGRRAAAEPHGREENTRRCGKNFRNRSGGRAIPARSPTNTAASGRRALRARLRHHDREQPSPPPGPARSKARR